MSVLIHGDKRSWTLLVYMAGDNDLANQGTRDLEEMLAQGTTDHVGVAVLFDHKRKGAIRYVIPATPRTSIRNCPKVKLGKINTGDPQALADFIQWGRTALPAERLALILWDHGDGWRPYNPLNPSGGLRTKRFFNRRLRRVTGPGGQVRYFGIDDQGRGSLDDDWLDMGELEDALVRGMGGQPLDLLAFDACLMAQVEVLYEVRATAHLILASEEEAPLTGYPYKSVLAAPGARPDISARTWAEEIVRAYLSWGQKKARRTACLIEPTAVAKLAEVTDRFAAVLTDLVPDHRKQLVTTFRKVQRFGTADYADLLDIAEKVNDIPGVDISKHVKSLRSSIKDVVLFEGRMGTRLEGANGVSIYLPRRRAVWTTYRPSYLELDFARTFAGWTKFLDTFFAVPS